MPGRRQFFKRSGQTLLGTAAALNLAPAFGQTAADSKSDPHLDVHRRGRLGNPEMTMLDDKRLDPRVRKAMSGMPAGGPAAMLPQVPANLTSAGAGDVPARSPDAAEH